MQPETKKYMTIMLIGLAVFFGAIFVWKIIAGMINKRFLTSQTPIVTVSTMQVPYDTWRTMIQATGSLRAINGVYVTTELAGLVQSIYFQPGSVVKKNVMLVQLNADSDMARLQSLQANAELARVTYRRDLAQFEVHAVSKATIDTDIANVKSYEAQVNEQAAIVRKKSIVAPFAGRLGINLINLGQYLSPGDRVVTLQSVDPIYVDFYVPQQQIPQLKVGQTVTITTDSYPKKTFTGKLTTINPDVDVATRNIQAEATLPNPTMELKPGMFASVSVDTGAPKRYLTVPQAAVSFNPYGDIVFVVREQGKDHDKPIYTVHQAFVTTGDTRGDQVAILKGLKENDVIVTSGQLKLKNNTRVAINNSVQPSNSPAPDVPNER